MERRPSSGPLGPTPEDESAKTTEKEEPGRQEAAGGAREGKSKEGVVSCVPPSVPRGKVVVRTKAWPPGWPARPRGPRVGHLERRGGGQAAWERSRERTGSEGLSGKRVGNPLKGCAEKGSREVRQQLERGREVKRGSSLR